METHLQNRSIYYAKYDSANMLRDCKQHPAGDLCTNARFTSIKHKYLIGYLMSRLCINLEILAAAARVQLRLSGRNEMPDNCQNEMGS